MATKRVVEAVAKAQCPLYDWPDAAEPARKILLQRARDLMVRLEYLGFEVIEKKRPGKRKVKRG